MKRRPAPPPPPPRGPAYWRSLDELAASPGFRAHLEREFPDGASSIDGVDRRLFLKLMAASFALGGAGLAGCRRPESHILPGIFPDRLPQEGAHRGADGAHTSSASRGCFGVKVRIRPLPRQTSHGIGS